MGKPRMRGREEEKIKEMIEDEDLVGEADTFGRTTILLRGDNHRGQGSKNQRLELRSRSRLESREGEEENARDFSAATHGRGFPQRLVRQGGKENRSMSKRGKQGRGKGPKRNKRRRRRNRGRGKKVGRKGRFVPRSRLKSLKTNGSMGDKSSEHVDAEEEAGSRKLRRQMRKLRKSRQLYLEQEQYR